MNIDLNGILCWLGGIGTKVIADVISAQIKNYKNKSLKLDVKYHFVFAESPIATKHVGTILALKIMNTGQRKITIEEWGFVLNNKQLLTVIPSRSPIGSNLPSVIEPDSCETLSIYINDLQKELLKSIKNGDIKENSKLQVYARDNFSKKYKVKTSITYKQICEYINIQNTIQTEE